eukprot:GEMP01090204.1.p1 GENE.GEMP01090204.1~~GEMP01090204.1.p1  ORF type:complete len:239 (+),score=28.92 GEMP01090204.1:10-726(+)
MLLIQQAMNRLLDDDHRCQQREIKLLESLGAHGAGESVLAFLSEVDFCKLRAVCRTIAFKILDSVDCEYLWRRFYDHCLHVSPSDLTDVVQLKPREIFFRLMDLKITGVWTVAGRVTDGSDPEPGYRYEQSFVETKRDAAMESRFSGEASEAGGAKFWVHGKRVGNGIMMFESIVAAGDSIPAAINICSGVLALDGKTMTGIWSQHYSSKPHFLTMPVSSGVFEARKLIEDKYFGKLH